MAATPKPAFQRGHIFLSYAGADTQAARQFAEVLRRNGLEVWFDKDSVQPGEEWQPALEKAISEASAMVVYVGGSGVQAWVDREVRFGLVRNTQSPERFRFIPVLGQGANPAMLPPFVQQHQCVALHDPEQMRRLVESLRTAVPFETAMPPAYWTNHSPFRGLQVFSPEDAWLFFGRDNETDELLNCLRHANTLAVIGNSGSGKSSLIQASLIPALRRGRFKYEGKWVESWRIAVFRPSSDPFGYLAETLPGQLAPEMSEARRAELTAYCRKTLPESPEALRNVVAQMTPGVHTLLFVDQLEELFTLVQDKTIRSQYIESLQTAARLDGAFPVYLVMALRADFYAHCLELKKLSDLLHTNLYNVPLISPPQLREAIENRLALANAGAEAGLIDTLLADVGDAPGNLALLEHALAQLWVKSGIVPRRLTSAAYAEIGRLRGAIGRHADEVFNFLGEDERRLARRIFLELVQFGEGGEDARRRVAKQSLLDLGPVEQVQRVIAHLASNRLVTTGGPRTESPEGSHVEISHEALIRGWPTLRGWLEENREDIRVGRLLLQTAQEVHRLKRDSGALKQCIGLALGRPNVPDEPPFVSEFLAAVCGAEEEKAREEREFQEHEFARQRDLWKQGEARAEEEHRLRQEVDRRLVDTRRSAVRSRTFSYSLGVLFLGATGAAFFARSQQLTAQSQTLVARAEQTLERDQPAALTLAIRGWRISKTPEASVAIAHSFPQLLATLTGHADWVVHASFSPDGRRIVTASGDKTSRVWNTADGRLLGTLEGHKGVVWQASFSPDGQRIITASEDRTVRLWDAASRQMLATFQGHLGSVWQATFSPDGQRIVTASEDATARVLDAASGRLLATLVGHKGSVWQAVFSPDGKRIVTGSDDKTARVWDVTSGRLSAKLEGHLMAVLGAAFSPDGQRVVTASEDKTARIWDSTSGQLLATLQGHTDKVLHAEFSRDGRRVVTASEDRTAGVWNAATGHRLVKLQGHAGRVWQAAFSPDGRRIVTASGDKTARIWDSTGDQLLAELGGHGAGVVDAVFSPDGQRIVTVSLDSTAQVWNTNTGQLLASLRDGTDRGSHCALSPNGQLIVTSGGDEAARVWNTSSGQPIATLEGHAGRMVTVAFSPDNQRVLTAGDDNRAQVWSATNGQLVCRLERHSTGVVAAVFSPDGQRVVTANASSDKSARVWNAANGQLMAELEGHTGAIADAVFSPDGQRIVTASADNTAGLWNASNGQLLAKLEGHTGAVVDAGFSPDGQRIVTASADNTARLWNASNGRLLTKFEGHSNAVTYAAFSPDGQRIVTASADNTARVWNVANGQLLAKLEGHTDGILRAEFSPDGQSIATASKDRTAKVWNSATGELIAKLRDPTSEVLQAVFSQDGRRVITASGDGAGRVYQVITLSELAEILKK